MSIQESDRIEAYLVEEGTWGTTPAAVTDSSNGIAVNHTASKFTCSTSGAFSTLAVGMRIVTSGFATPANNQTCTITAINDAGTEVTVDGTLTVSDAADTVDATLTPYWHPIRMSEIDLDPNKETTNSKILRNDRMVDDDIEVSQAGNGSIGSELTYPADSNILNPYGRLIEGILEGAFSRTIVTSAANPADWDFGDGTQVITGSSALFGDFSVGQWIRIADAANSGNVGDFLITANDNTILTCSKPGDSSWSGFTAETAASATACTIIGMMAQNGTTRKTFSVERQHETISKYEVGAGMRVSGMDVGLEPKSPLSISFGLTGKKVTGSGSTAIVQSVAASTKTVINTSANIGTIMEGGSVLSTAIKSVSLSFSNSPREREVIGSKYPAEIVFGKLRVTGTVVAYLEDLTLFDKIVGHTASAFSFQGTDTAGNTVIFTIQKCYFKGKIETPGEDTDGIVTLEISGTIDKTTTDKQLQIDILAA